MLRIEAMLRPTVADTLQSHAVEIFSCVLAVLLVATWVFVMVMTVRGVVIRQILFEGHAEDREEGGFIHGPQVQEMRRQISARSAQRVPTLG